MKLVAVGIAVELCQPPFATVCWCRTVFAPAMAMPKAPMDENNSFVLRQDDVGTPGQSFPVQPEPVAQAMQ
jgi:hypothetical protein